MVKCPFCGFDNEDGALFCEQCKSDLSSVPAPAPAPDPTPLAFAEAIAVEAIAVEAVPVEALPVEAEAVPVEAVPIEAVPVEAVPAEAIPVAEAPPVAVPEPVVESVPAADVIPAPLPQLTMPIDEPPIEVPAPAPAAPPPAPVAAAPAPAAPASTGGGIPPGAQLKLVVQRGLRTGVEFPIYPDYNYIGRSDDKPVDIDLDDQEAPDRVWCSRQHAVLHYDDAAGILTIEDLNSSNGTYVNRARVYPGQKISLNINDVVQIGTVHLKLRS